MRSIWMYWENPWWRDMPKYLQLCVKSVERHKGDLELHMLGRNTIKDYLPDLCPEWHRLKKPAHRADYIRTRLVYKYGGLWLDCDMVAVSNIEPLFDFPEKYDYACQDIGVSIGCFIARPGCKLLREIIEEQDKIINEGPGGFGWNGIGNDLLTKYGKDYSYYKWPEWTLDAVAGGEIAKILSTTEKIEDNLDKNAVFYHLYHNIFGGLVKRHLPARKLLASDMLVSKIFRKALYG